MTLTAATAATATQAPTVAAGGTPAIARDTVSGLGEATATSVTCTWAANPKAGDTVLVFVSCPQGDPAGGGVVDNGAAPSTFVKDVTTAAGKRGSIWRADSVTLPASGSYQVTATSANADSKQICGVAYTRVKAGGPVAVNSATGTSTSASTGAASPSGPGGLCFGGFTDAFGSAGATVVFGGGFPQVEEFNHPTGATGWPLGVADALAGVSQVFTWTIDNVAWGGVIAAYDAAPAGVLTASDSKPGGPA
jgi:hypothetical protein